MLRRRRPAEDAGAICGTARVDPRTKDLVARLLPGEIAVIDHADLDRVAAEGLVERGAAAVVNASASITGRYPNEGPGILARAGIPLIDAVGADVMERVREGDVLWVEGARATTDGTAATGEARVTREGETVAEGAVLHGERLERALAEAEDAVGEVLDGFVRNTIEYLADERHLILGGAGVPPVRARLRGRHVLVVVRGHDYKADLRALRGYIAEVRPAIVAVDGAADALLEDGLRPDVIIGDMDSVSTAALTCGAELIVHAYPDGRAPGLERTHGLGLEATSFASAGTSEDIALLLAYEHGAEVIVAVGSHANLIDFLDKGRGGMASTFLVRLRVGQRLVDAKGVSRLYRTQVKTRDIVVMVSGALVAMAIVAWVAQPTHLFDFAQSIWSWFGDRWFDLKQVFR